MNKMEVLKGMCNITCARERDMALECWKMLHDGDLTPLALNNFDSMKCDVYFNTSSGNVFLCDEDINTVMVNGDKLDLWIFLSYAGQEGFIEELLEELKSGNIAHIEDVEQLYTYCNEKQKEEFGEFFKDIKENR